MPVNLRNTFGQIESIFGESFNFLQKQFQDLLQPISEAQNALGYQNDQALFLLNVQKNVPYFNTPQYKSSSFKAKPEVNNLQTTLQQVQIQPVPKRSQSSRHSSFKPDTKVYQQQLNQVKAESEATINQLKQQMAQQQEELLQEQTYKQQQLEFQLKYVESEKQRLTQMDQNLQQRQLQQKQMEHDLQQKAILLKQEIHNLNTNYKQKIQSEIEKIQQQRNEYEQKYALDKAQKEHEIQQLQERINQMQKEADQSVTLNTGQCLKFLEHQETQNIQDQYVFTNSTQKQETLYPNNWRPSANMNINALAKQAQENIQNQTQRNSSNGQTNQVPVNRISQGQNSSNQMNYQARNSQQTNQRNSQEQNNQFATQLNIPINLSPQNISPHNQVNQMTVQMNPINSQQIPPHYQTPNQPRTSGQIRLSNQNLQQTIQHNEPTTTQLSKSRISNVEQLANPSPAQINASQKINYVPFPQQNGYKIPKEFRLNIEKDRVPVADWAQGQNLKKCVVYSAQVKADEYFQQSDKPTVYDLFGIQNHPYDSKARCTQVWGKDKLQQRDIDEYNRAMGWM
ncbi:Conserved_hypothetical protein [Hexamita inflata]|uniref:Uncharacterized protein n=1 Tax=Hexamita inflata TaxID=28002 RepID=A0AA86RBU3_9EUKA|nr:Conserved hypothetical protein [Hexamita inflata]